MARSRSNPWRSCLAPGSRQPSQVRQRRQKRSRLRARSCERAAQQRVAPDERRWQAGRRSQVNAVFYGRSERARGMMERRDAAGALLALLLIAGCRLPPQEIITTWPEGLLPGYQELNCEWYDPDSTAIRYSYMLPTVDGSEIERLRWQIHRSGWKAGSPRESCFAVLEQTSNHLV